MTHDEPSSIELQDGAHHHQGGTDAIHDDQDFLL